MKNIIFKKAFTLIELLVVIAIISLLSSVVLASLASARNKARVAKGLAFEREVHNALLLEDIESLIAEYAFDENTSGSANGAIFYDSSGNERNATGVNDVNWSEGVLGGAVELAGTNDYVSTAIFSEIDHTKPYTFSVWIYPELCDTRGRVVFQNSSSSSNRNGLNCAGGEIRFGYYNGSAWVSKASDTEISLNKWYHVVGVNNGGTVHLFIDGVEQNNEVDDVYVSVVNAFWMGRNNTTGDIENSFRGKIDNVRVYSAAYIP